MIPYRFEKPVYAQAPASRHPLSLHKSPYPMSLLRYLIPHRSRLRIHHRNQSPALRSTPDRDIQRQRVLHRFRYYPDSAHWVRWARLSPTLALCNLRNIMTSLSVFTRTSNMTVPKKSSLTAGKKKTALTRHGSTPAAVPRPFPKTIDWETRVQLRLGIVSIAGVEDAIIRLFFGRGVSWRRSRTQNAGGTDTREDRRHVAH
jgi:hypothetical protein